MARKKKKEVGPRVNESSISYMIYRYLKQGVESRDELVVKIHNHFESNNIIENTKTRKINLKSIISNINEILRYLKDKKQGWYSNFQLNEKAGLKIVERAAKDGNKNNTIFESTRAKKIQD